MGHLLEDVQRPMPVEGQLDKILVVDDDENIRRLTQVVLGKEYQVKVAADGKEALATAAEYSPHLIVLDLGMPRLDGRSACVELRRWFLGSIVILSGQGQEETVVELLDLGADDYIVKPFRPGELLARIRALLRRSGKPSVSPTLSVGPFEVDLAERKVRREGDDVPLTRTEFDIFALLAQNRDRLMTWKAILTGVWGPVHGDYTQSLRVHIGHLRRKLEPDPANPRFILTEPGVGFRFCIPESAPRRNEAH